MSHLSDVGMTYVGHLLRAWKWSFCLFVHGVFPNVWKTKVSSEMCNPSATRAYLLKTMYGIDESKINNNHTE